VEKVYRYTPSIYQHMYRVVGKVVINKYDEIPDFNVFY
jgi:hypothetical protein